MKAQAIGAQQGLIIVVIGNDCHPQWSLAWSLLEQSDTLFRVSTIKAADALVQAGLFPDLIVFFEDHIFQFCEHDWHSFLARSPLTQAVLIFNDWCESEPRTGRPLPGVIRIHWLSWVNSGRKLLSQLREQRGQMWGLPPTASEEQRLLAQMCQRAVQDTQPNFAHIAVITPSRESFTWIHQAALSFAQYISWVDGAEERLHLDSLPDLLIIDTWSELIPIQDVINSLRAGTWPNLSPFVPCLVLASFPRWELVQEIFRRGNTGLLKKPFLLTDFESALADLARRYNGAPLSINGQCTR